MTSPAFTADVRAPGRSNAPSRIVAFSWDGQTDTVLEAPTKGRQVSRGIWSPAGRFACYELRAGDSVDNPAADVQLVVDGERQRWPSSFGPRGHHEWSPGGTRLVGAVLHRTDLSDYQLVTHSPQVSACKLIARPGIVEPSWTEHGILAYDKRGGLVLLDAQGVERWFLPTEGHAYDPYLSPDGRRVVYLVNDREGLVIKRNGLRVVDVETGEGDWVVGPFERFGWLTTHARWVGDRHVLCSMKTPDEDWWHAALVEVDTGDVDPLTDHTHGSVDYCCPLPRAQV